MSTTLGEVYYAYDESANVEGVKISDDDVDLVDGEITVTKSGKEFTVDSYDIVGNVVDLYCNCLLYTSRCV